MKKIVLGCFNEDDTLSWCFYHDEDAKKLKERILKYFTDVDIVKSLIKHDIQEITYDGRYIKHIDLKSQKPFSSKYKMLEMLEDEAKKIFIYDSIVGWLILNQSGTERELKIRGKSCS